MNLSQALEELQAGKCMSREAWLYDDGYLKILPGMSDVWKIMLKPNAGNYIFTIADLQATDWKEFELAEVHTND